MADNLQRQRYEHKYIIREDVALAVRDFVSSYLEIDSFGATQPNLSYPVHSLYLDSPDLRLYQTTINGDKNRYKLRIRFYEDRPKAPVFFKSQPLKFVMYVFKSFSVKQFFAVHLGQPDTSAAQLLMDAMITKNVFLETVKNGNHVLILMTPLDVLIEIFYLFIFA